MLLVEVCVEVSVEVLRIEALLVEVNREQAKAKNKNGKQKQQLPPRGPPRRRLRRRDHRRGD